MYHLRTILGIMIIFITSAVVGTALILIAVSLVLYSNFVDLSNALSEFVKERSNRSKDNS